MSSLREMIVRTGRSPIFRVSWSADDLASLRKEGAQRIQMAATERSAQFDLHLAWPGLLNLITDKVILSHLTDVFGEDCFQLVETRLYPKPPGSKTQWHIDLRQLLHYSPSLLDDPDVFHSVTTWLALGDVTADMGPIQMLHYRHVNLRKLVRLNRDRTFRYREECEAEAERQPDRIETLPMKAGEFVMFDPRNLHTGAPNKTRQLRLGLVLRYCASHVHVDPRFSKNGDLRIVQIRRGKVVRPVGI